MKIQAFAATLAAVLSPAAVAASLTFGTVIDNLDRSKVTKLHAQEYCKSVHGQQVSWSGEAYDVNGGRTRAKILVAERSRPIYRGYNIVVVTDDVTRAALHAEGRRRDHRSGERAAQVSGGARPD